MIDNIQENFKIQPDNGFLINSWTDDINDTELYDLKKVLNFINDNKFEDVTLIIRNINLQMEQDQKINYSNIDLDSMIDL